MPIEKSAAKKVAKKIEEEVIESQEEETVSVPKSTLDQLIARMDQQALDIKNLRSVADKGRLSQLDAQNAEKLIPEATVSLMEGKLVVGWQMLKDEVGFDQNGRQYCNQTVKLFLKDTEGKSSTEEMDYVLWVRNTKKALGKITGKEDTDKGSFFTLELEDFGKVSIPVQFVNPW